MEEYDKAAKHLEESIRINEKEQGDAYKKELSVTSLLYLCYKNTGNDYDEKEVYDLLKETKIDRIGPYTYHFLYLLLDDRTYLENAYNKLQDKADKMDDEMKKQFFNYTFPKMIVDEWEKIQS